MNLQPLHIVFVVNHPSPHMGELFRALAKRAGVDLDVIFVDRFDKTRDWGSDTEGFPHRFLDQFQNPKRVGWFEWNPGIKRALASACRETSVAVLSLYTAPTTWLGAEWLNAHRVPWFLLAEPMSLLTSPARAYARTLLFKRVASGSAGILAISLRGVDEYRAMGFPRDRVHHVAYYIDTTLFEKLHRRAKPTKEIRFLSCGQLIPRKGFDLLIDAFARVSKEFPGGNMRIVGTGPMREPLMRRALTHGLADRVKFEANVPYSSRDEIYADADVFVLATRNDGWGMVVPEALASGLPVISTTACGAARDLIVPDETGAMVKPRVSELAEAMRRYMRDPGLAFEHGRRARETLKTRWGAELGARKFVETLGAALSAKDHGHP
ncbi:glycosyltransferase family 4 protein [Candidatus Poribacteria bacterium]|nr:glycosyltransferase family 4 protein [Candidatus Poribacteria bacterium]